MEGRGGGGGGGISNIGWKVRRKETNRKTKMWVNLEMDLRLIACGGIDWIDLADNEGLWRELL
jgi:hypothetical protein